MKEYVNGRQNYFFSNFARLKKRERWQAPSTKKLDPTRAKIQDWLRPSRAVRSWLAVFPLVGGQAHEVSAPLSSLKLKSSPITKAGPFTYSS